MAEIEWKGIVWKAAYGDFSVKELLTILKGFGPMELLQFEKPGCFRGQLSLSLAADGTKEITLYYLQVYGTKRRGKGREALRCLKGLFKGDLYVEDPGVIRVKNADAESLRFWVKMFREGLIDALDCEPCQLNRDLSEPEVEAIEAQLERGTQIEVHSLRGQEGPPQRQEKMTGGKE